MKRKPMTSRWSAGKTAVRMARKTRENLVRKGITVGPEIPLSLEAIHELQARVEASLGRYKLEGGTAELANEENEDGPVIIKDADGKMVMWMPRDTWDQLKAMCKE